MVCSTAHTQPPVKGGYLFFFKIKLASSPFHPAANIRDGVKSKNDYLSDRQHWRAVCDAAACGVLGILYYVIFYSRLQCTSAGGRGGSGRRLLELGSGGASTHDTGGDRGASTHIFMFKKSWSQASSSRIIACGIQEFINSPATVVVKCQSWALESKIAPQLRLLVCNLNNIPVSRFFWLWE